MARKKTTFNLEDGWHQGLKLAAAVRKREMVELLEEALGMYFGWNQMTKIEMDELEIYRMAESLGPGRQMTTSFSDVCKTLGYPPGGSEVVAQLMVYLAVNGFLVVEVYVDGYKRLSSFSDGTASLYMHGQNVRLQLTIPGRVRFQQLQARQAWEQKWSMTSAEVAIESTESAEPVIRRWNINEIEGRYAATNIVESVIDLHLGLKRAHDGQQQAIGRFRLDLNPLADKGFVNRRIVEGSRVFDVQIYRGRDGSCSLGVRQHHTTPLMPYAYPTSGADGVAS